jgi:serine/threonine-protein kinase PpkA
MTSKFIRLMATGLALSWFSMQILSGANADVSKPLLMPGKKSLYQRVLTRPEAVLYKRLDASTPEKPIPLVPFSVLYVYAKKKVSGKDWIQVGMDKFAGPDGWVESGQAIDWKQSLIVAFKDPLGHDRVLLFKDRESLKKLVKAQDLFGYQLLYRKAAVGEISDDSPVVSIQPKAYVDILSDFYLVPILQHEDIYIANEQARLLKVSTLPLREEPEPARVAKGVVQVSKGDESYRSGIVFVVDSTISMGPYINRTREAVRKVYDTLIARGLQNKVSFGLIAYRDNLDAVPQLGYLTRTYATLQQGVDPTTFFKNVKAVRPALVSSKDFVEDAFAGVKQAIDDINWDGFNARYVILITDAGARSGHDPLAHTGLNAEAIRQLARDRGLSIWVLHLLTPEGKSDHATAAEQYKRLSYYPEIGHFYYPVQMGSVAEFGRVLDLFAAEIANQVEEAFKGVAPVAIPNIQKTDSSLEEFRRKISTLGYALRMRYLQKQQGGHIPSVFNAWLVDRDFINPSHTSLEVRVLLTRDQLSDLQYVLKRILETAEEGVLSPKDFLDELKSVAATMSRDPEAASGSTRATGGDEKNLADLGYMREYIEDLPYTGEVMNLSLDTWEEWPTKRQLNFLHRLESKINYYQAIHDNTDLWISLDRGPIDGDSVFPMALQMLP